MAVNAMMAGRWQVLGLALAGVLGSGAAWAEKSEHTQNGAELYHDHCSVCHGDRGDGQSRARSGLKPPPKDFTTAEARQALTRERMIASVINGVPGTAMVGWGRRFSATQIEAVVDHIRNDLMRVAAAAPAAAVATPAAATAAAGTSNSRGRQVYMANCSVCHGDQGAGGLWGRGSLNPPPRDFTAPESRSLTRAAMLAVVEQGKPGTAMPGFGNSLSREDREAVIDYLRTSVMGIPTAAPAAALPKIGVTPRDRSGYPAADMAEPLPTGLIGDLGKGGAIFQNNCFTCHGALGNGDGPRAYFIFPKPRNFNSEESRRALNRPALFLATKYGVLGREMPGWGQVLSDQQIADVAEYVFQTFIRPGG